MKAVWLLAPALALAGCKLVDQTTFAPSPEAVNTEQAVPQADPRAPLLTIGYATPNPNYQEVLRYAVRTAEARTPGVQYDVIAILPAGGDVAQAQANAAEVMRGILAQGVPASRVHLGLRPAAAGGMREVRVYVR
jgi:type IV pilus biogenesis protein CpaD/CtpE